ncbi:MAG: hypothetical protein AUJ01_05415 [Acidobacteria bacterium 13_1_40CM_3_65_5]|nr:MAG: hypothetical protein AUJ01_05415 [Acidobacteria bacterium 13_1_40CM_3_65_5]
MFSPVATFKTLDDITLDDLPLVGGKASNCARLKQAGISVPDGLVIPSDATDADVRQLASDPWLASLPADALFAVRSSGIGEDSEGHSFAGIHETQLNVRRDQIVEAVVGCRRSATSEQAIAYRKARGLEDEDDDDRIGVLVQRMVPAVTSGVAFTVNPITGADEIVINAAPGLGEALVSGRVTPDEFRLRKSDLGVLSSRRVSDTSDTSEVSEASDLATLGRLLVRIEQLYGAPQDVEWCHDGQQYWIVQSRPVTTRRELITKNSELSTPDAEWTRANLAEVLPDQVSPQALSVYVDLLNLGERRFFGRLMAPDSELGPIVTSFHGRMYFNLSQLRHVTRLAGAAPADMLRSLGHSEQIRPEDEIATRPPLRDLLRVLPDFLRLAVNDLRAKHVFRDHEARTEQALARLAAVDPRTLSDQDISATFQWWLAIAPESLKAVFVMSSVHFREDFLRKACAAVGFSYDRLVYPQLAAGERSVSTQQAVDLVALANVARHEAAWDLRRLSHGACGHDVPRAVRAVSGAVWAPGPLRIGLGDSAAARESRAGVIRHPRAAAGQAAGHEGGRRAPCGRCRRRMARVRGQADAVAAVDAAASHALDRPPAQEAVRLARAGALGSHARAVAHPRLASGAGRSVRGTRVDRAARRLLSAADG